MSPEAQRVAIAEALGWSNCHFGHAAPGFAKLDRDQKEWVGIHPINKQYPPETSLWVIPDFCNDLNACHIFENLNSSGWLAYEVALTEVITRDHGECTKRHLINAEAAQRAEAFLRAKGLWKE